MLDRALELLRRMDEFSQSRFRLEARYHHVLVDEFQDTSRAQWELVALLIQSWGEGTGVTANPSIFVVGDRKQSIYRFRDAESAVLQEAARHIQALRPAGNPRRSITKSFRSLPTLLAFVNELFAEMADEDSGGGRFTYTEDDRFPTAAADSGSGPGRGQRDAGSSRQATDNTDNTDLKAGHGQHGQHGSSQATVWTWFCWASRRRTIRGVREHGRRRDRADSARGQRARSQDRRAAAGVGGGHRGAVPLARESSRVRARARAARDSGLRLQGSRLLRRRRDEGRDGADSLPRQPGVRPSRGGVPALALRPSVRCRARDAGAAAGRGRARSSDQPGPDSGQPDEDLQARIDALDDEDQRVLAVARRYVPGWVAQVDRVPPAELFETILADSAYLYELGGPRQRQAWENVKKMRSLVRRIQNHGYATMPRIAEHLDSLTAGDESNAVLEALDAVNLMTVHASKGLEFPIVFVVNMAKGASGPPRPVRVTVDVDAEGEQLSSVTVGPFVSEMDEAERLREKHETKRLLYVALTRARDRLYLASALKDGVMAPGRGSLGEVLPQSVKELFAKAGRAALESPIGHRSPGRAPPGRVSSGVCAASASEATCGFVSVTAGWR